MKYTVCKSFDELEIVSSSCDKIFIDGKLSDISDMDDVFDNNILVRYHINRSNNIFVVIGNKIEFTHAKELFDNVSIDFCCGIHAYFDNDYIYNHLQTETQDFQIGYRTAMMKNLKKKYIMV